MKVNAKISSFFIVFSVTLLTKYHFGGILYTLNNMCREKCEMRRKTGIAFPSFVVSFSFSNKGKGILAKCLT